jgi:glycerol uptake facilitator-like aquaporin
VALAFWSVRRFPSREVIPYPVEWVLLSFGLMLAIAAVATDARVADGFAAVAVGLIVGFCALLGPLTGSSTNPARSFGPAIVGGVWTGHWLYWAAPVTGMMTAARLFDFLRHTEAPGATSGPILTGVQGHVDGQ